MIKLHSGGFSRLPEWSITPNDAVCSFFVRIEKPLLEG